ncbi:MAG: hypothetical protein M1600_00380 [Firmicutes bacterium]|jgi:hypothetical protein|nr:hypothetical protein [Bacillota bacterium]
MMSDEVNLSAQFTLPERAEACAEALRDEGFDVIQIDPVRSFQMNSLEPPSSIAEWGRYAYQPDIVDDKWTQATAENESADLMDSEAWLLTAVVETDAVEEVRTIIRHHGGFL